MTWNTIATFNMGQDWQLTPAIAPELGYVRFKFASAGAPVWIAQVDPTDRNDVLIWDERRLITPAYPKILQFDAPAFFSDRTIAIKLLDPATPSFQIQVEVSDMPISRAPLVVQPVASTAVNASAVPAATSSTSLLAANPLRKSASILNNSPSMLYIELGATASYTAYTIWLGQGDMYELPTAYTGVISGIWAGSSGNALVREFV